MAQRSDPADNPRYSIMTINMNGPSAKKGTAKRRRKLLSRTFESSPSDIVFCQETCPGFEELMAAPENFKIANTGKEAAVIWSTKHFNGSQDGLKATDRQIRTIRNEICEQNEDVSELLSKIAMAKLTPRLQSTDSILAVSFHGPHNRFTGEKKKRVFLSLLKFLDKVIEEKNIRSYIIGGDFNFDTSTITELPNLPEDVVVGSYELSPRSQDRIGPFIPYKDNFIYYPEPNLNVLLIKAIDLDRIDPEDSFLLDHDPIVGMLHFTPQTKEGSPSEDVETLSKDLKRWKPF
ncbi:Hypothetical predicted protein [Paramuricea clavata]|uniref:Uncharacterized protein n=1 Tax=Paramuricea clavata TaxID=317549 RepID=A0A6S7JJC2_PARCT|nr:Hypothetical predicted protein [Paramuricea clavata]